VLESWGKEVRKRGGKEAKGPFRSPGLGFQLVDLKVSGIKRLRRRI